MTRSPRFPVIVLAVLAAVAVAVIAIVTTAVLSTERDDRLAAPFAIGETWYACEADGGPTLTLVADADEAAGDCAARDAKAGGATLHAPAGARVDSVNDAALCLDLDRGGSVRLDPVSTSLRPGDAVAPGETLGTLAGTRLQFAAWTGAGCAGDPVPFDTASGMRLLCADDDPAVVTACPTGELGGVDLQAACDAQYPDEGRTLELADESSAFSWRCTSATGASDGIEVLDECVREYGLDAYGVATDARDPYSWICVR